MKWSNKRVSIYKEIFPETVKYVENFMFNSIKRQRRVCRAFMKYSHVRENDIENVLGYGGKPYIRIKNLVKEKEVDGKVKIRNSNGRYKHKTNTIYIDNDIAFAFERYPKSDEMQKVLESTILHEIVHWARDHDGNQKTHPGYILHEGYKYEVGKLFEGKAYNGDVTLLRKKYKLKIKNENIVGSTGYGKFKVQNYRIILTN